MKFLALAAAILLLPAESHAISRYVSTNLSCGEVRAIIREEGAALMRWQSRRVPGLPRYGRYVADSRFCDPFEYADLVEIPAADTEKCPVKICERRSNDDDLFFRRRR